MISARTTYRGRPDARRGDERAAAPQLQRERRPVGREARRREEQARGLAHARDLCGNQNFRHPTPSTQCFTGQFPRSPHYIQRGVAERRARERRGAREVQLDPRRRRGRDADDGLAGARPRVAVRVEALEEAVRAARRGGDGALVEVMRQRRLQLPLVVAQLSLCDVRFEPRYGLQLFDELLLLARLGG